ncbi:hypothetical protein CYMTET_30499 [Cymbomonas tetramitiformis]|uniref:Uncharacterized protein n=1 Tax=Cymbomonas tetramitiformis TaxID=36881 RepID=A0AAE0FJ53_9CHLO|nr:hypothetical protein CYMTET_30499 [Cymbomonas tetramitiformis]
MNQAVKKRLALSEKEEKVNSVKRFMAYRNEQLMQQIQEETKRAEEVQQAKDLLRERARMINVQAALVRNHLAATSEKLREKHWAKLHPSSPFTNKCQRSKSARIVPTRSTFESENNVRFVRSESVEPRKPTSGRQRASLFITGLDVEDLIGSGNSLFMDEEQADLPEPEPEVLAAPRLEDSF